MDPRQQFLFITDLTVRGKALLSAAGVPSAMLQPDAALDANKEAGASYSETMITSE
ncbi:hypothetical protein HSBAA_47190 [Vreelandella sulfidaeris]|uniref:Uncharacterized protein n=1 Tax=Vreelandella sulfidaeris TaxID=115553 RepID=A0A455UDN2_9GAMM|nr:hypothetical protein HSBAA_47190 [Halomonas sulfidaeris]